MGLPDNRFEAPIKEIVRDLARGNYEKLEADGRSGRSTAEGLREAVERYGGTLVELPDEAFDWMDDYPREGREGVWALIESRSLIFPMKRSASLIRTALRLRRGGGGLSFGVDEGRRPKRPVA